MKLTGRDASAFFTKPDTTKSGVLLFGSDAMRVSLKRQALVKALVGPEGESEMRLTRLQGAEVRKDGASVLDEMKATGFFPGPRVVLVEEANDSLALIMEAALKDWQKGDAMLVVTGGQLAAKSKLRKVFEGDRQAVAIGIYDDPPTRDEIERSLTAAGLTNIPNDAMNDLTTLSRALDPGDFAQTLEKLALYKLNDDIPLSAEDIDACAPVSSDAGTDDMIHIIAEGKANEVGPMMNRLTGQGINPTTMCIFATRHFKTLHAAVSHPNGPDAALSRARPPVFGPRKDRMVRQARGWGVARVEGALGVLMDTDLSLRSSQPVPAAAVVERAFIRIAMMRPK